MNGLGLQGEGGWLKIGTPGISQVLQPRLGRHARYLPGSPTHTRQTRQVCARCQDREIQQHIKAHTHAGGHPWCQPMVRFKPLVWAHAEQGSHCNVLHCRYMDARNAIFHLDFEKYFLFASSACQQCQKRGQLFLSAKNVDLSNIQNDSLFKILLK